MAPPEAVAAGEEEIEEEEDDDDDDEAEAAAAAAAAVAGLQELTVLLPLVRLSALRRWLLPPLPLPLPLLRLPRPTTAMPSLLGRGSTSTSTSSPTPTSLLPAAVESRSLSAVSRQGWSSVLCRSRSFSRAVVEPERRPRLSIDPLRWLRRPDAVEPLRARTAFEDAGDLTEEEDDGS